MSSLPFYFCRQTKVQRVISARSPKNLRKSTIKIVFGSGSLITMDRRIAIVISLIDQDPRLDLSELAKSVNLSTSRLRHLFKREIGIKPGQYLKQVRLEKAEMLLRTTFLSIKEIIGLTGLPSSSHFVRDFKSAYGLSPSDYREINGPGTRRKRRT